MPVHASAELSQAERAASLTEIESGALPASWPDLVGLGTAELTDLLEAAQTEAEQADEVQALTEERDELVQLNIEMGRERDMVWAQLNRELVSRAHLSLRVIQNEVGAWADATFPSHHAGGVPHPEAPYRHLTRPAEGMDSYWGAMIQDGSGEAWELGRAIYLADRHPTAEQRARVEEEAADCLLLLLSIVHLVGGDLGPAVRRKLDTNKARKWGTPDSEGVVEHVREGER